MKCLLVFMVGVVLFLPARTATAPQRLSGVPPPKAQEKLHGLIL